MIGPPGAGKTMLSQRLATILPPLSLEQSLETTRIYSSVGLLTKNKSLIATLPVRMPHNGADPQARHQRQALRWHRTRLTRKGGN